MIEHTLNVKIEFGEDELSYLDSLREWASEGTGDLEIESIRVAPGLTPQVKAVYSEVIALRDNDLLFEIVREVTGYPFPEGLVWRATSFAGPTSTSERVITIEGRTR